MTFSFRTVDPVRFGSVLFFSLGTKDLSRAGVPPTVWWFARVADKLGRRRRPLLAGLSPL